MNIHEPVKRSFPWSAGLTAPPHKMARGETTDKVTRTLPINETSQKVNEAISEKDKFELRKQLAYSIESNNVEMIRSSIRMGADINSTNPRNGELLLISSVHDTFTLDACDELLAHHPDLDAETEEVGTALHAAVLSCNLEAVRSLVLAGSDPFKPRKLDGLSSLDFVKYQVHDGSNWWPDEIKRYRSMFLKGQKLSQ